MKNVEHQIAQKIAHLFPSREPMAFPEGPETEDAVQMPRPEWGPDEKQTAVSVGASLAFGGSSPPVGSELLKPACQELLWNYATGHHFIEIVLPGEIRPAIENWERIVFDAEVAA